MRLTGDSRSTIQRHLLLLELLVCKCIKQIVYYRLYTTAHRASPVRAIEASFLAGYLRGRLQKDKFF